jgi:hypothetical protein
LGVKATASAKAKKPDKVTSLDYWARLPTQRGLSKGETEELHRENRGDHLKTRTDTKTMPDYHARLLKQRPVPISKMASEALHKYNRGDR